jgi:hypothetical protein
MKRSFSFAKKDLTMANKVYNDSLDGLLNTPANVPGWTVQNAATGSDQSTVTTGTAASVNGGALLAASQVAAQTPLGTVASTQAGTQSIAAAVDALNAALVAAGIEV